MKVFVVAWEHSPGTAGSGGFNWFAAETDARAQWAEKELRPDFAHFFFEVEAGARKGEAVTAFIDADLAEYCAKAAERWVGAAVLAYWQANGFKMGDATSPGV